jgi:hypothetical protein
MPAPRYGENEIGFQFHTIRFAECEEVDMPRFRGFHPLAVVAALALPAGALAEDPSRDERIAVLERQVQALTEELAALRTESAVPEEKPLTGERGYAPAASKVFGVARGLSIGGYGEINYVNPIADSNEPATADTLRLVTYLGYKFSDSIAFNSEIEIEHARVEAEDAPGEVAVEFASLDFAWKPELGLRAGLLLTPMGFINEVHEPPYFHGVFRPQTERMILPATWRELGAGAFGRIGEQVEYRAYVLTGFNAAGFSAEGIREGRQEGGESLAENLAFVGRVDVSPDLLPGLDFGGSFYAGKADQNQGLPETKLWIAEGHAQYRRGPLHARALFAYTDVSGAGALSAALALAANESVAKAMLGGYVEAAYDVWPLIFGESDDRALEPFVRFEYLDTQHDVAAGFTRNRNLAYSVLSTGISYFPHPNVVLKAEYRNQNARSGKRPDEIALGLGFAY